MAHFSFRPLEPCQVLDLYRWLRSVDFPINRQFGRDYSDGLLVARLLKQYFPSFVDLSSFQSHCRHDLKIVNWQMLHFMVLRRIKLPLSREQMSALAHGDENALESFLYTIKANCENIPRKIPKFLRKSMLQKQGLIHPTKTKKSMETQKPGETSSSQNIVDVAEEAVIPFAVYESAINEIQRKNSDIKIYLAQIKKLERLLTKKNSEIEQLKKPRVRIGKM